MKKTYLSVLILALFIVGCTNTNLEKGGKQLNQHSDTHLDNFPIEELSGEEIEALELTLNDEYKAEAIYQKVLDKFGDVKPFSNIINAEKKHSTALIEIYKRYNLEVPANEWYDRVPEFDSVKEACEAGVEAEIENVALYDKLFQDADNQDITAVFTSLRDASENNHLPAFQRCSGR